jgi:hypothetical protein
MDILNYFGKPGSSRHPRRLNLEELEQRAVPAPVAAKPSVLLGMLPGPAVTRPIAQAPLVNQVSASAPLFNSTPGLAFSAVQTLSPGAGLVGASTPAAVSLAAASAQTVPFTGSTSISLGFPTAALGFTAVAPSFFSSSANSSVGAANPERTAPASPLTPAGLAPLAATARYITQDINLSGGGAEPSDYRAMPPNGVGFYEFQTGTEEPAEDFPFVD